MPPHVMNGRLRLHYWVSGKEKLIGNKMVLLADINANTFVWPFDSNSRLILQPAEYHNIACRKMSHLAVHLD